MVTDIERRKERSSRTQQALMLQLRASAERTGAQAMVLADHQGLVIAQSSVDLPDADELAAVSPFLATSRSWAGTLPCSCGERPAVIASIPLDQYPGYLCALGVRSRQVVPVLEQVGDGIRRILFSPKRPELI